MFRAEHLTSTKWILRSRSNPCNSRAGIVGPLVDCSAHTQYAVWRLVRNYRCRQIDIPPKPDLREPMHSTGAETSPCRNPPSAAKRSTRSQFARPSPEHPQACRTERLQHQVLQWRCAVLRPPLCILFGSGMLVGWPRVSNRDLIRSLKDHHSS
jgi:hypothetical protein